MSSPTYVQVWTQISNAVKLLDDTRNFGSVNTPNLVGDIDTLMQAIHGDAAPASGVFATRLRAGLASLCASGRGLIDPHLADMAKAILSDAGSSEGVIADLYQYMITNASTIKTRTFVFGGIVAGGSNVGTGTIYRLTVDRYNTIIEAHYPTVTTAKVVTDANQGALPGREKFVVYQSNPAPDILELAGSGARGELVGHAGDEIIRNASFQVFGGTATVPTDITNWTSSLTVNATNYQLLTTDTFRTSPEEAQNAPASGGTPYSLQINATGTLTQKLRTLGVSLSPDVPYVFGVRWRRDSAGLTAASGTLKVTMGSKSTSVAVAAQTGWQTLVVAMDNNTWMRQFDQNDLALVLDWTRTGGQLLLDDVFFGPMTRFDGEWLFAVGGATNWIKDDIYTFTDTETGAKIQRWISWLYPGMYLPSAALPTIADP